MTRSQNDIPTDRHERRDLSKGWLPVSVVIIILAALGSGIWWTVGQSRDITDARREAAEAAAMARHEAEVNRSQADQIAAQHLDTAVIQTQLAAIRAQLDRIEAQQHGARP